MIESKQLVDNIVEGIQNIKGKSTVIIDLTETDNTVSSYFIIASGDSSTHVKSIADSVTRNVLDNIKDRPIAKDGTDNGEWVAIDYSNVMVHIFQRETREFYNIEELWADGKFTYIEDLD